MIEASVEVAAALDALIASGPLSVAFQPIVDLAGGQPLGHEVLGRCGPVQGPLSEAARNPASLLSLAHAHGRLLALDRTWRQIAIAEIAARRDAEGLFFVNVDPRVVDDPTYSPGYTLDLVRRHRLEPSQFVLELTEVPSRNPLEVERVVQHYSRQGFKVALDDLGAGQQSLLAILRVSPDIIKLDKDLVRGVDTDTARNHLLRALADFARKTGIRLVAEGIETEGELRAVVEAGIPLGQGFLLGRPHSSPQRLSSAVCSMLATEQRRREKTSGRVAVALDPTIALTALVDGLRASATLESMLPHVTRAASALLGVERASLRLLDAQRQRLLVAARSGESLHDRGGAEFAVGEGLAGWVAQHATPLRIGNTALDPRFIRRADARAIFSSLLAVPLLDGQGVIGVLGTTSPALDAFSAVDERWLKIVAGLAAPYLEVARLERLTITDPLTSALNRRALERLLPHAEETQIQPTSVVAVDVDRFKSINDRFGHDAGDQALRAVVRTMTAIVRIDDSVVRLGGEEFLLVLPGANDATARVIAERVRDTVASSDILPSVRVTVSAGVAERQPGENRDALIARADRSLYRAKENGRNRVE